MMATKKKDMVNIRQIQIKLRIRIYSFLSLLGLKGNSRKIAGSSYYLENFKLLKQQEKLSVKKFKFGKLYPCLKDRFDSSGEARGHYFHQDLLVARKIFQNTPSLHVDAGSRIDGFVAHVAAFREIEVFDVRPLAPKIPNVVFTQIDLMQDINDKLCEYCDSLSSLHAIEHFGLGRYGDPVKYDGYLLGLNNLYKVLKKGGKFYFSVPIGPQRIEFDAHRVFSINYLLELFKDRYRVDCFSYVDDKGDLHNDVSVLDGSDNFGCNYGCGIFEMTKL